MKSIIAILIASLCAGTAAEAQTRKKKPSRSRVTKSQSPAATVAKPRIIGSTVSIVTKNGDRITGELLDLTAYSVRFKADNLESTLALDTIASLSLVAHQRQPAERINLLGRCERISLETQTRPSASSRLWHRI